MGIMTFGQMKEEILIYHAGRSDLTDSRLNRLIDLAQYRIARRHNWDDLKFTVIGNLTVSGGDTRADRRNDRTINVANLIDQNYRFKDFYSMKLVDPDNLSNQVLTGLVAKSFDAQFTDPDWFDRRMPIAYTWYGSRSAVGGTVNKNIIEIVPAPDIAYEYTMRFQVYPRTLGSGAKTDNSESDFYEHDDAIINYVVSQVYQSLGREDKAMEHYRIYNAIITELIEQDSANIDNNIVGVSSGSPPSGQYWADPFVKSVK